MSRVSVIVPNYNRESLIGGTLENLLLQSQPPHEIIVVDDGSTDGSVAAVRKFGDKVKLLQQANQGPGAARNAGLAVATGDYIQFQDSDDLLSLNKLAAQAKQLDATGADIAFGPWAHVFIRDRKVTFKTCVLQQSLPPAKTSLAAWQMRGWATVFQSLLFRRAFLTAAGGYRTDLRYGEDMEYFFRLLIRSPRAVIATDTLTLYRLDAPNKLSCDDGLAKSRRDVDWAKCFCSMIVAIRASDLKTEWQTRWIFLSRIRKHLRYLPTATTPADLMQTLNEEIRKVPAIGLAATELWLRLAEQIRLCSSGHRWLPGYQAAPTMPQQLKLIQALGFETGQPVAVGNY